LTSEQWNLISNIIHLYDEQHLIVEIKYSINQMCSLPLKLRSKLSKTSDLISKALGGVQIFIERSLHLQSLSNDARRALIKHNMHITGSLNTHFIFRELDLYNNLIIMNASTALYNSDVMTLFVRNSNACDPNGVLIKIFIFVLIFSINCSIVTFDDQEDLRTMSSSINLIEIQNIYVTAFWKYLVYLCGFDGAVIRFSSMIKHVLNILYMAEIALNNATHNQMVDALIAQTERSLKIIN